VTKKGIVQGKKGSRNSKQSDERCARRREYDIARQAALSGEERVPLITMHRITDKIKIFYTKRMFYL